MHSQGIHHQRGISTLVVAIVLLIAATFLTFFAAKIGIQEIRMSSNDFRQKQAFTWADAALDRAKIALVAHAEDCLDWVGWTSCTTANFPCGDGSTATFNNTWSYLNIATQVDADVLNDADGKPLRGSPEFYILRKNGAVCDVDTPVVLLARATSDDDTASAIVRQAIVKTSLVNSKTKVAPIVAPAVAIGGSLTAVANPNGGGVVDGNGIPLSVWTDGTVDLGSAAVGTCHLDQFRDNSGNRCIGPNINDPDTGKAPQWGQCGCEAFITKGGNIGSSAKPNAKVENEFWQGKDIVDYGPFPTDLFEYLFGMPRSDYLAVKNIAKEFKSCDALVADIKAGTTANTGVFWVTGPCDLTTQGLELGSQANPVILIVDGDITFGGGAHVWGLAYEFNPNAKVKITGTFNMHGAFVSEADIGVDGGSVGAGTFNSIYDPDVFLALTTSSGLVKYAPIDGGWNDAM